MQIVEGVVIGGNQLGRKLGFPTANIALSEDFAVENGVYASKAYVDGKAYAAMTNVGVRPSVDGSKRLLETHLFGFEGVQRLGSPYNFYGSFDTEVCTDDAQLLPHRFCLLRIYRLDCLHRHSMPRVTKVLQKKNEAKFFMPRFRIRL